MYLVLDYGLRRQNRERWMTCFGFEWTRRSQQLAHDEIRGSTQDQRVALLCRADDGL